MNFITIWKTLWKQLWKQKLALSVMNLLSAFLYWVSDPEHRNLPAALGIALCVFAGFDLLLTVLMYVHMKPSAPYYRIMEECGPCEEAVQMHRHLFPNPKAGERLARIDLLISLFRMDEAEAELSLLRPEALIGVERLRYLNDLLLIYAYTLRREPLWNLFQTHRQEAGRLSEKYPVMKIPYFNTAELALALNGDAAGSEMYCQYIGREAGKKHGSERITAELLAMVTRTERLYALGQYDAAAAMDAQTRAAAAQHSSEIRPQWRHGMMLKLLDHAKIFAANNNTGVSP